MSAVTPFNRNNIELFTPDQISGLALWLDGADINSLVLSGSNVSQWNDKSGNNRNLSPVLSGRVEQ